MVVMFTVYERMGYKMSNKTERDIEKTYSNAEFIAKLRRLADALEDEERFSIQIDGERIHVPDRATFTVEHERM